MVKVEYVWLPTKYSRCGQLAHNVKHCLVTTNELEDGNVIRSYASISVPIDSPQSSAPVYATNNEVVSSTNIVSPTKKLTTINTAPAFSLIEQVGIITHSIMLPTTTTIVSIESPPPETVLFYQCPSLLILMLLSKGRVNKMSIAFAPIDLPPWFLPK